MNNQFIRSPHSWAWRWGWWPWWPAELPSPRSASYSWRTRCGRSQHSESYGGKRTRCLCYRGQLHLMNILGVYHHMIWAGWVHPHLLICSWSMKIWMGLWKSCHHNMIVTAHLNKVAVKHLVLHIRGYQQLRNQSWIFKLSKQSWLWWNILWNQMTHS